MVSTPNETPPLRWGVIGLGVAGRARARAIRADPRASLVAGFRGDCAAVDLPEADTLDALLHAVDAVAICTPDPTHPALVKSALLAGCHVVCEYPLAPNAAKARELYAFADAAERVLHVEHIELLTGAARWLRGRRITRLVAGGSLRYTGGPRPECPTIVHANISRLHRLIDIAGLPEHIQVRGMDDEQFGATFMCPTGARFEVEFHQVTPAPGEKPPRRMELVVELSDGVVMQLGSQVLEGGVPVTLPKVSGLFAIDQLAASAQILDGMPAYLDRERLLRVLALVDRLAAEGGYATDA